MVFQILISERKIGHLVFTPFNPECSATVWEPRQTRQAVAKGSVGNSAKLFYNLIRGLERLALFRLLFGAGPFGENTRKMKGGGEIRL